MENKERTRTHQDARELTAQLSKLCTLDTETQQEVIECIEAFLTSRSIDADLRNQTDVPELTDQFVMSMLATNRNTDLLRQELLKDNELILSQRDQLQAQSVCYQDNLTEIKLLKAQVVSREKEVDVMMAQRNLAEAKLLVLEQREVGYLSELDDYARTVLTLRSRVKACEAEHGLNTVKP